MSKVTVSLQELHDKLSYALRKESRLRDDALHVLLGDVKQALASEPAEQHDVATPAKAFVEYDLSDAWNAESAIHKKLIECGWTPPANAEQPGDAGPSFDYIAGMLDSYAECIHEYAPADHFARWHYVPEIQEMAAQLRALRPQGDGWSEVARLLKTIKYLQGIAERGEGRQMRDDETLEAFVLGYVKKLEAKVTPQGGQQAVACDWPDKIREIAWKIPAPNAISPELMAIAERIDRWRHSAAPSDEAVRLLRQGSFLAQTTGGTAGRDEKLVEWIGSVEAFLARNGKGLEFSQ